MALKDLAYGLYRRRLTRQLTKGPLPRHVGLIMDGNRRWARQMGFDNPSVGHRYGAEHVEDLLGWCAEAGIDHVTVFVASLDNLSSRAAPEVQFLLDIIENVVADHLARPASRWRVQVAGRLDALPDSTAHALKVAVDATRDRKVDGHVTVAVGYDGHQEITDAVRSLLTENGEAGRTLKQVAETLTPDDIAKHLYASDLPDPELVIRTSGEVRASGFLLWQTAHSDYHFCDAYWPAFRHIDFLRALRTYAQRKNAT
ncbi:polyprenyl diphosphate synthase [Fodinicola feengrottensis]|uniref:Isoprenyl transferase n=1 Tax=Fodinicola feengrottensis TaxID=435914 RepID=A0ABP4TER0_9ACTN|nr:polyprenyl diphosphate synthase [Fodinicola feengrottensis]